MISNTWWIKTIGVLRPLGIGQAMRARRWPCDAGWRNSAGASQGRVGTGASDLCTAMGVPVTKWDMAETAHSSHLPEILAHDIFLNCILARPVTPVFAPSSAVAAPRRLSVIGDIACDHDSDFSPIQGLSPNHRLDRTGAPRP